MATLDNYRRPGFPNRPWISGGLYDLMARPSVLHCDAYVMHTRNPADVTALVIDWREGGRKRVALDAYMIEPDGLTPLWDAERHAVGGVPVYWTRANHTTMRRVHMTVLNEVAAAEASGRWARVSLVAHYVHVDERDPWRGENHYRERKPYAPRSL